MAPSSPRKKGIAIDWTINVGHMISIIGVIAAAFAGWWNLQSRVKVLEEVGISRRQLYADRVKAVDKRLETVEQDVRDIQRALMKGKGEIK